MCIAILELLQGHGINQNAVVSRRRGNTQWSSAIHDGLQNILTNRPYSTCNLREPVCVVLVAKNKLKCIEERGFNFTRRELHIIQHIL